jgi:Uma2 family endonuclease
MKVKEPDLSGTYTYADYLTWRMDEMVELIHGKIYKMSPAPASKHQLVAGELYRQIANYLLKKPCQVFIAPFDVRLPSSKKKGDEFIDTVVQPDICVICDAYKIDESGCLGAPNWIIEILSPHTSHKDIRTKYDVYEKSKVKEYWLSTRMKNLYTFMFWMLKRNTKARSLHLRALLNLYLKLCPV